jgi:UDP-GlcNAc:undecaprenyl-phosphate GlcNAc-1-phosphate transferase
VLAVPLYDFTSVMVIRLAQHRSPFQPDKSHFSHRLVELGLSPPRAVLTIYLATLTTGLAALVLYQVPGWGGAWLVIVIVVCVLAIVAILETTGRRSVGLSRGQSTSPVEEVSRKGAKARSEEATHERE